MYWGRGEEVLGYKHMTGGGRREVARGTRKWWEACFSGGG